MNKFSAEGFYKIGCLLGNLIQAFDWINTSDRSFPTLTPLSIVTTLGVIEKSCRDISLIESAKCAKRFSDEITSSGVRSPEMGAKLDGLQKLIFSEMESQLFLHIRSDLAKFYKKPTGFDTGPAKPSEAFPSITKDVEQAGNCLVSELGTACVFHLMRIMESGLKALAAPLGIPYAPSWESYLKQIDTNLKRDWKDKTPEWKTEEVFFKEAAGHLSTVRVAWRNPTMHIVRHYDVSEAEEIFISVRTFMRHLATKLKE